MKTTTTTREYDDEGRVVREVVNSRIGVSCSMTTPNWDPINTPFRVWCTSTTADPLPRRPQNFC